MNTNKFLVGGIAGGIVYFVLGYVLYGLLFKSYFADNGMSVDMSKMEWWAMILSCLAMGFLFAFVLGKANANSLSGGAGVAFVVGLLMSLSFDLGMYSMGQGLTKLTALCVDVVLGAVMAAITGAAIAWVNSMGKKAA
jgi:hypothetical protein